LKISIKKKLCARSGRVKSVDIHPEYPWILAGMYSGSVTIYDYEKQVGKLRVAAGSELLDDGEEL